MTCLKTPGGGLKHPQFSIAIIDIVILLNVFAVTDFFFCLKKQKTKKNERNTYICHWYFNKSECNFFKNEKVDLGLILRRKGADRKQDFILKGCGGNKVYIAWEGIPGLLRNTLAGEHYDLMHIPTV